MNTPVVLLRGLLLAMKQREHESLVSLLPFRDAEHQRQANQTLARMHVLDEMMSMTPPDTDFFPVPTALQRLKGFVHRAAEENGRLTKGDFRVLVHFDSKSDSRPRCEYMHLK